MKTIAHLTIENQDVLSQLADLLDLVRSSQYEFDWDNVEIFHNAKENRVEAHVDGHVLFVNDDGILAQAVCCNDCGKEYCDMTFLKASKYQEKCPDCEDYVPTADDIYDANHNKEGV